jgi:hypothetical protein
MQCRNCGKTYDQTKNEDFIPNSPYCSISCNFAFVALENGQTIESVVSNGMETTAAKMCRNMADVWAFQRAMAKRAAGEIERLEVMKNGL